MINHQIIYDFNAYFIFFSEIEQLISEYNIFMPKEEDLNGAALALVRLQDTYNLNMSDLARGEVLGYQSRVEMSGIYHNKLYFLSE